MPTFSRRLTRNGRPRRVAVPGGPTAPPPTAGTPIAERGGAAPVERRRRVIALEVGEPFPDLGLRGYEGVLVVALHRGAPIGRTVVATDGLLDADGVLPGGVLEGRVRGALWWPIWLAELRREVNRRLGPMWWESATHLSTTVAVCTRDRPVHLERCLGAVAALDPAPDRVLVIDNASKEPCREIVERHGFEYCFEPRPGLDNARNTAIARCDTELLCFTDDDCLPLPGWLAQLDRFFADPVTGAVTGWACAFRLDSSAQISFETSGGFTRGWQVRRFDWQRLRPTNAGATGAGANMSFRTEVLREIGGFPPELDAGTRTQSGGDIYALGRVLAVGRRVVFNPGSMVWHDHRADQTELRRVMRGYGRGIGSMASRALICDRELPALAVAWWPFKNFLGVARSLARRRVDLVTFVAAAEQARGTLEAPLAWRRELRSDPGAPTPRPPVPPADRLAGAALPRRRVGTGAPEVSVVVPTVPSRRAALERCLRALGDQTLERDRYELIAVPNGPDAAGFADMASADLTVRCAPPSAAVARNAGAAAATGELIVFIDDDILADAGCLEAHLAAHRAAPGVALGPAYPPTLGESLTDQAFSRWWFDHYARKHRDGHRFTFVDLATGNMSIPRDTFRTVGGFDPDFPTAHREDWEFGVRLLKAGVPLRAVPAATAVHHHAMSPTKQMQASHARGFGDVVLAGLHPVVYRDLPLVRQARPIDVGTASWRSDVAFGRAAGDRLRQPVEWVLEMLERGRMRALWGRCMGRLSLCCYRAGVQDALDAGRPLPSAPFQRTVIDLDSTEPIETGIALGEVTLRWHGRELGLVVGPDGQWDAELIAEAAVDWLAGQALLVRAQQASGHRQPVQLAATDGSGRPQ